MSHQEVFNPLEGKSRLGYCLTGRNIRRTNGPASEQFAEHVISCRPCSTALKKEQNAMHRDASDDRRASGQ